MAQARLTARALVPVALTLILSAACGSSPAKPHELGAAEPATSPPLTTARDGRVVTVSDLPQGIAYDAKAKLLAVAVHDPYRIPAHV